MKSLKELQKERMLIRKENPIRSNVIVMVIDGAKKIAKEDNREVEEKDLLLSAKRQIKAMEKTVATMEEYGEDASKEKQELLELGTFLPPQMSEDQLKSEIHKILATLPEDQRNNKSRGKIMGQLKALGDAVDMGLASKILGTLL